MDVKCKLKLKPDNTGLIVFGSKRQRDKLNACFPIDIGGSPLCPVEVLKILGVLFGSDFPCPNMFRMSANVVLCNSVTLDMSDGFSLKMFLYLWPVLLLVVGWITVTHFLGASLQDQST